MNTTSLIYKELRDSELEKVIMDLHGSSARIQEKRVLKGGLFNTTYFIKTNKDMGLVLRVAPINRHLLLEYEKDMMSAEPIFSKLLLDNSVKTSVVVRHAREGDVIGREYIIMDYIPSVPMSEVGKNVCNYKKLKRTYQEIGQLTRKMNSISNPKFGWLRNHDRFLFDTWYEFICFFSDEITHKLALNNIFNAQFLERFNVIIKNSKEVLSMVKESNLSHTDLWQGNVLISKSNYEVLAIIDVDRAIFGDRYWDLSTPWIINKDFLMGYGESFPKEKEIKQRMQIYALLSSMVSCYVRKIQYNDIKQFYKEKTSTIKLLDKIYKEFS